MARASVITWWDGRESPGASFAVVAVRSLAEGTYAGI
jgi:hypothetical protein